MPTKRRQNTPGKTPRPSRNSRAARTGRATSHAGHSGSRANSFNSARKPAGAPRHGFSTSGPKQTGNFGMNTAKRPSASKQSGFPSTPLASSAVTGGSAKNARLTPRVLLTRRNLLIGAAAVGGLVAVGGGVSLASNALNQGDDSQTTSYISVSQDAVQTQNDYNLVTYSDYVKLTGTYSLPYGSLVWADNDTVAACLTPGETTSPLCTVSLLYFSSGNNPTVLNAAQGADDGFEIFDVRASESGLIWLESNTYESQWRVYTGVINQGSVASIQKVDEGDANWLMPSIAAVGNSAFWQLNPNPEGDAANERAVVKASSFGSTDAREVFSSKRAFATRITAASGGVVITPRAEDTGVYYTLTKLKADSYETVDQMTLPASMTPDIAGYGRSGFSFGYSNIYNYGGGIANLGTYTPRSAVNPYNYNNLQWFRFSRSPVTAPCWSGDWLIVKSTTALSGIHFAGKDYFAIDVPSGADTFGEQLVSSGTCESFVGLSQIRDDTNSGKDHALIRVFTPINDAVGDAFDQQG